MTRLRVLSPTRACGDCDACCTTHAVTELDKSRGERCGLLGERGCGVYETRPQSCRRFDCAWRLGAYGLTGVQRPDRCGLVVWTQAVDGAPRVHVGEARAGALETAEGRALVRRLAETIGWVRALPLGGETATDYQRV